MNASLATVAAVGSNHNLRKVLALACNGRRTGSARERWYNKQSAALPYRWSRAGLEVMLVTSRTTRRWVLPKGSIGSGLTAYQSAVLEAYEEAGVGGRIGRSCIGVYGYTKRNEKKHKRCLVKVFPLRVAKVLPDWPERRQRRRQWVSFRTAAARVQEGALKKILSAFERQQLDLADRLRPCAGPMGSGRCSAGRGATYIPSGLQMADGGVARRDCLEAAGWALGILRGKDQGAQ